MPAGKLITCPREPLKFCVITPADSVLLKVISELSLALLPNITFCPAARVRLGIVTKLSTANVPPVTETSLALPPFKVNAPPVTLAFVSCTVSVVPFTVKLPPVTAKLPVRFFPSVLIVRVLPSVPWSAAVWSERRSSESPLSALLTASAMEE